MNLAYQIVIGSEVAFRIAANHELGALKGDLHPFRLPLDDDELDLHSFQLSECVPMGAESAQNGCTAMTRNAASSQVSTTSVSTLGLILDVILIYPCANTYAIEKFVLGMKVA
jgi:hypothetical protein